MNFYMSKTDEMLTPLGQTAQNTLNQYVDKVEADAPAEPAGTEAQAPEPASSKPEAAPKPEAANVSPAPAAPAPSPAAPAAVAAAPSPTPSFQKKSSMPGWVLPAAALVAGGVGGYLVGKSAAKSSSDKSSASQKSTSSGESAQASSSGESAAAAGTASEASAPQTAVSATPAEPATQEVEQVQATQPAATPVQTVTPTNDTRRVSVSSTGSAKKSWKGLKCPEVTPVESYNPVVINSNKAMTDLRNQCLADGGRP